ncbi:MAG: tetratricopeptide repeat protein [Syntrophomonadaceae bacterium]|jgi:tetratricopeptide (TPR) repeat protein|nr:tetratricopeptide repeat protein [Syntrophomonadaceae bacterium]
MENIAGGSLDIVGNIKELIKRHDISVALEKLTDNIGLEDVRFFNHEAHCEFIMGNFRKAEELWKKTLSIDPDNVKARMRLTEFYSPAFQAWLKRFTLSVECMENKNYEKALDTLKALLEEKEGIIAVYQLLGISYLARGDKNNAVKVWEKGLEIDRANPLLISYLDNFHKPVPAEKAGYEAFAGKHKYSNNQDASHGRNHKGLVIATCLLTFMLFFQYKDFFAGKFSVIDSRLHNAPPTTIKKTNTDFSTGSAAVNENIKPAEARPAAGNAAPDYENGADKPGSGSYLSGGGDTGKAVTVMAETVYDKVSPGASVAENAGYASVPFIEEEKLYYKGMRAYRRQQWAAAKENLQLVVSLKSADYLNREALYYLARVNYLSADYDAAEKYYDMYLREFPNTNYYDDSLYFLGKVYYKNNKMEKAADAFSELNAIAPDSGYLQTQEAFVLMAYIKKGNKY